MSVPLSSLASEGCGGRGGGLGFAGESTGLPDRVPAPVRVAPHLRQVRGGACTGTGASQVAAGLGTARGGRACSRRVAADHDAVCRAALGCSRGRGRAAEARGDPHAWPSAPKRWQRQETPKGLPWAACGGCCSGPCHRRGGPEALGDSRRLLRKFEGKMTDRAPCGSRTRQACLVPPT